MAYTTEQIKAMAETLMGETVSQERAEMLSAVCAAAVDELNARLKKGVTQESIGNAFAIAAGMLAVSMYMGLDGEGDVTAFKAGNISVSRAGVHTAEKLRQQAEALLAAYLADSGFVFTGVSG